MSGVQELVTHASSESITVVVPAFNAASLIAACLESVVHQDYRQLEVIVVDGASTDGTVQIAQAFARDHPFVRCISEPDKGVYDAINKGVRLARGEWVYVLGCDDRLAGPGVFTALAPLLATDADFLHARVLRMSTGLLEGGPLGQADIVRANICQQAILYRKSLFARLGLFDLGYRICADWAFNIQCFGLPCKPVFSDVVLCHYDGRGMSSRVTDTQFYRDRLSIALKAFRLPVLHPVYRTLRYLFRDEGRRYWEERRPLLACKQQLVFLLHAVMARFEKPARR